MEFLIVDGERVPVPPEIVSAGRDAVAAWAAQLAKPTPTATPIATRPAREE